VKQPQISESGLNGEVYLSTNGKKAVRILHSFPHRLGTGRIADIAWYQINGVAKAGGQLTVFAASNHKPLPASVTLKPTLSRGKLRVPYKVLGNMRTFALHDYLVSRKLEKMAGEVDIVHVWPLGGLRTIQVANRLGIPTVMERPNAHTRFAYEVVQKECERLGVTLPPDHEHAYKADVLEREEQEYRLAYRLLCPSEFVVKTFLDYGFAPEKLVRHIYGVDEKTFYPGPAAKESERGLTALYVGVAAVRNGLHYALEAWLKSPAHLTGKFLIAGEFIPSYAEKLAPLLADPSVHVLGHRDDIPDLMRKSDVMILPSIEEGFGLVCTEAMASGVVPLVSDACTDICKHSENSLVHHVGDVAAICQHITMLHEDRSLLQRLRAASLKAIPQITWDAAGVKLLDLYREIIEAKQAGNQGKTVHQKIPVDV
jgi:glycosyltransferase involved in cell wall biosynthesis